MGEALTSRRDAGFGWPMFAANGGVFLDAMFITGRDVIEVYCGVGEETREKIYLTPHGEWEVEKGRFGSGANWSWSMEVFVDCRLNHDNNRYVEIAIRYRVDESIVEEGLKCSSRVSMLQR